MAQRKSSKQKSTGAKKSYSSNYNYGKRPTWQWILIYIVLGAVVYGLFYYLVLAPKGKIKYNSPTSTTQQNYKYK